MHRLFLALALTLWSGHAWCVDGCRALLCFADPGDPRSIPECAATVEEVLRELALGGSFPTCDMVSGPDTPSVSTGVQEYYPCGQSYGTPWQDPGPWSGVGAGAATAQASCTTSVTARDVVQHQLPSACERSPCVVPSVDPRTAALRPDDPVTVRLPRQRTPGPNYIDVVVSPGDVQRFWWSQP